MTTASPSTTQHIFSVDVEEYFQVSAFDAHVSRDSWDRFPSRVADSVGILLDMLAEREARGTFFTLGWIADRHPNVVRRIAAAGHEIASHGWWHRRVPTLTRDEFRRDIRDSKAILEDVSGQRVLGFRAPSFSIVPGYEWALEILVEEGFAYDSSLFPIRRSGYGYASTHPAPHTLEMTAGPLIEFPLATTVVAGKRLPAAGGGYLRQLPFALIRRAFREHDAAGTAAMFYIHPWELDPGQPRLPTGFLTRVRHYRGLGATRARIARLLDEFSFTSVERYLARRDAPHASFDLTGDARHVVRG